MKEKTLDWILGILLSIAFISWLFAGVCTVYVVSVCLAGVFGMYYFFKYMCPSWRELLKDDSDEMK